MFPVPTAIDSPFPRMGTQRTALPVIDDFDFDSVLDIEPLSYDPCLSLDIHGNRVKRAIKENNDKGSYS